MLRFGGSNLFGSSPCGLSLLLLHPALQARDRETGNVYIVARSRLPSIPPAVPKVNKNAKEG